MPAPSDRISLVDELAGKAGARAGLRWRVNLALFLATCASALLTSAISDRAIPDRPELGKLAALLAAVGDVVHSPEALRHGAEFTGTLLAILLAHELGHYFAARWHKVETSLPFFIPMPLLSPFGTMGAVIRMQGKIPSRRALHDIGAAGPLAGLVLAVPLYIVGLRHSTLVPLDGNAGATLGESLGLRALEWLSGVQEPAGMSLELSPMAFAAWGGMFVTMINLIPAAQLDGGHVAYALFGKKQDGYARVVHRSMLAFFLVSVVSFVLRDVRAGIGFSHFGEHVGSSLFWLVWFEVLAVLGTLGRAVSGPGDDARDEPRDETERPPLPIRPRAIGLVSLLALAEIGGEHDTPVVWISFFAVLGLLLAMEVYSGAFRQKDLLDHPPPTDMAPLDPVRRVVAVVTLALFALLFMPTPISV